MTRHIALLHNFLTIIIILAFILKLGPIDIDIVEYAYFCSELYTLVY